MKKVILVIAGLAALPVAASPYMEGLHPIASIVYGPGATHGQSALKIRIVESTDIFITAPSGR